MSLKRSVSGVCALAILALSGLGPGHAMAASLRDSLGASADDRFTAPVVGRFRPEGGAPFVVNRTDDHELLMRFETSPEIWVLHPHAGPRGDVIYKNDMGQPVLRATRVGGLTLFTEANPGGVAAAFTGGAPPLRPTPITSASQLLQAFSQASAKAGRVVQSVVTFEARNVPLRAAPIFADAAQVAAQAFVDAAGRIGRNRQLDKWSRVEFVAGNAPTVSGAKGVLRITIAPDEGLSGRPSSARIADLLVKTRR